MFPPKSCHSYNHVVGVLFDYIVVEETEHLVLESLLVDIGGSVVLGLVDLVANGVLGSGCAEENVSKKA